MITLHQSEGNIKAESLCLSSKLSNSVRVTAKLTHRCFAVKQCSSECRVQAKPNTESSCLKIDTYCYDGQIP